MRNQEAEKVICTEEDISKENPASDLKDAENIGQENNNEDGSNLKLSDSSCINEEEKKRLKRVGSFIEALTLVTTLCIVIYCYYIMSKVYVPKERELSSDNLFSGNELIAEGAEVESIIAALEDELGVCIEEDMKESYCVLNAIRENPNLTDEEKQVFFKFVELIDDNPYLDKEAAYASLLNVDVDYVRRPDYLAEGVVGAYFHKTENIGIFNEDLDRSTLIHEIIHCIYCNEKTEGLPTYFKEGMAELLANEYFSDSPFLELSSYPFEIAAVKMLCEVTSPDIVLQAFSSGDMGIIAKDMAKTCGDLDAATLALEKLDYAFKKFNGDLEKGYEVETDDLKTFSYFIPLFRDCIEKKYDEEDSSRISYFYNEILFFSILEGEGAYTEYANELVKFGADYKAYFSSKLKKSLLNDSALSKIGNSGDTEKNKVYMKERKETEAVSGSND